MYTKYLLLTVIDDEFTKLVKRQGGRALTSSDHEVAGWNSAGGEFQLTTVSHFIAQSLSLSSVHRLDVTYILLKGT